MMSGAYRFPAMESVIYGQPFTEALKEEVERPTPTPSSCWRAAPWRAKPICRPAAAPLGNRFAGVCAKIGSHTPRVDFVAAANAAREAGADLIVTLGGGSVTDAAKMVAMCLGNGVTPPSSSTITAPASTPTARRGAPSQGAGSAHDRHPDDVLGRRIHRRRRLHRHRAQRQGKLRPSDDDGATVVLDPPATVHTPEWLFLSTGIRAVDHAVEDICSASASRSPKARRFMR